MKKFLAALIIGAFTLTGIGCSGEKDKTTTKDKVTDAVKDKDKTADKDKDKKADAK